MQSKRAESSFIFTLARSAAKNVDGGYYRDLGREGSRLPHRSLRSAILKARRTPLIAEIKFTSPAEGKLRPAGDVSKIARAYERGGVAGISVLTEPRHFDGDVRYVPLVKKAVGVPVLMKDIVIDPVQIDAAARLGADAVLFIAAIFTNRLSRAPLDVMFSRARAKGLEVLFEAHREEEYRLALGSDADIVGINNRNLNTLEVSLETSKRLLADGKGERERLRKQGRLLPVISESGIRTRAEIEELSELGADGFLIGSAFMKSADLEAEVRSLTGVGR
ncbi:MAG TPA: indole-3-glycerol-phosphate synthase [Nitrososphaerales archaeon]|nr:indole-3-glycerol-phosphate synthase [Nitrososphaerales archaeon]